MFTEKQLPRRGIRVASLLVTVVLGACSSNSKPGTPPSVVEQPTAINLYPSGADNRLFVFITAVGSNPVSMALIFDSGSAGITLDAHAIFPPDMFDASGNLIFSADQPFTYNGVMVTNQRATKGFGGTNGFVESGYLGYAQVTFGDAAGQLTTDVMPVFLYDHSTPQNPTQPSGIGLALGIFGVDPLADELMVSAMLTQGPECTQQTAVPCYAGSILKYLGYGGSVHAGFMLSPSPLQPTCTVGLITSASQPEAAQPQSCVPEPMLTIGLTGSSEGDFSASALTCPPMTDEMPKYLGPNQIQDYAVCEKSIPNSTITLTGLEQSNCATPFVFPPSRVLFDTGTQDMQLYPPSNSDMPNCTLPSSLPMGTGVMVSLPSSPSGFTYAYKVMNSATHTVVASTTNNEQNHVGVGYFETNSFFIDYTSNMEGWK